METANFCLSIIAGLFMLGIAIAILLIYLDHSWKPKKTKIRVKTKEFKDGTHYRAEFHRPILGWKGFNAYLCTGQIIRDNTWYVRPVICNKSASAYANITNGTFTEAHCPGQN